LSKAADIKVINLLLIRQGHIVGSLPDFSNDSSYLHINPLVFHWAVPGGSFSDYSEKAYIDFLQDISIKNPYVIR